MVGGWRERGAASNAWEVALCERDGAIELRYDLAAPRWVYAMVVLADGSSYRAPAVRAA